MHFYENKNSSVFNPLIELHTFLPKTLQFQYKSVPWYEKK